MLNTAIIGMGNWGRTLVNSVQGRNGAGIRFVAGTTGTLDKARDYAAEKGIRLHATYGDVLADPQVQAVALASPHGIMPSRSFRPPPLASMCLSKSPLP